MQYSGVCATHAYMFCLIDKIYKKAHRSLYTVNGVLLLYYIHNSGVSSPRVTTLFFSQSIIIPIFLYPSVMSCAISSLHAPHGGKALPSLLTAITRFILFSPFVSILNAALRSAHMPRVHAQSTHIPVYILPEKDSIAAAIPPASTHSVFFRGASAFLLRHKAFPMFCPVFILLLY